MWKERIVTHFKVLFCHPGIKSRRMRWTGHVECMGKMRNACNILVGKSERKRQFERPKRRWEDNIGNGS
jgi:hypothetical protein